MFQISEVLKKVPFFRTLGKNGINFIVERLKFKPFDADEVICRAGETGDKMFIIINGRVKVVAVGKPDDEENIISYLESGNYFGEMALLTGEPRSATVITTEPSEMFVLNKSEFDVILERFPSITLSMAKTMSHRLRDTIQKTTTKDTGNVSSGIMGKLSEKSLVDVMKFCENNSLNGTLLIQHGSETGKFQYERGELQHVSLGQFVEDTALDLMLNWDEGTFIIKTKPIEMENTVKVSESISPDNISRIVIVNNSMVVQKLLQRTFESMGYDVYTVETGSKGKKLVKSLSPNLIISDTKLPDGSGIEFLQSVREFSDVHMVLLTDVSNKTQFEKNTNQIKNVFFTNSQDIGEIVKTVENILK
jgi:CRP-like cAMP-binding protein/CheY-like chemotaxis protein